MRFSPQDKLALHPQLAEHMAGRRVYPVGIEISPSGVCQAHCPQCFYSNGDLGGFRKVFLETFRACVLLEECEPLGVKAVTWTGGGDPSLHPDIGTLVESAKVHGLDQGMFTNALAMPRFDPSLLQWIRVTMTDRPYKPECIRALRPCKTLGFAFNYRGAKEDGAYLLETLRLAEEVGADYVQCRPALKFHGETVDIKPPDFTHPLMQVTGYKFEEARKKHGYARCEGFHMVPFIFEDGSVNVCAYMRKHGPEFVLGNIYKDSLKDILDRAPQSVPVHENCQVACKLNEINNLVDRLRKLEDINFP
jgi:MoaA/NifB/PqqE/SkfB family radical SAM enzyme